MNDDPLKKKLSILKTAPVPKGYWASYWPRLQQRLGTADRRIGKPAIRHTSFPWITANYWVVPAFTALFIGIAGYRLGHDHTSPALRSADSPIQLVSDNGETQAQHVFKQMLDLFPKRVNWISFEDGKVDFSISSVAYPDGQELVPLIITLPRAKDPFEARVLIRPGQSARVEGVWDKKTEAALHIQLSQDGRKAMVSCRLNGSGLDTEVDIYKEGTQPLGSFRVGERLVQAQLTRLRKSAGGKTLNP